MGNEIIKTIYLNAGAPGGAWPVIDSLGADSAAPSWISTDRVWLRVFMRNIDPSTGAVSAASFTCVTLTLGMKTARLTATGYLATATLDYNGALGCYEGVVDLNTSLAIAAVAAGSPVKIWVDVRAVDAAIYSADARQTWQWPDKLFPPVLAVAVTPSTPVTIPSARVLESSFKAIAAGADSVTIDDLAWTDANYYPLATVVKPAASDPDIFVTGIHSITAAGFTVSLSAPTGKAGYYVSYILA